MNPTQVVISPGFADMGVVGKYFSDVFGMENTHTIPVAGHPKTQPKNPNYWVSAFSNEAKDILIGVAPKLIVSNSIHTIETLKLVKELKESGKLRNTYVASFAPAFDIPGAVTNMYNAACKSDSIKTKEDVLSGDDKIYQELMQLVKNGKGDSKKFCKDLRAYSENPKEFFDLVAYYGRKIKILLNPNDRIIFGDGDTREKQKVLGLNPIMIEGRENSEEGDKNAFMSHIPAKSVLEKVTEIKEWCTSN